VPLKPQSFTFENHFQTLDFPVSFTGPTSRIYGKRTFIGASKVQDFEKNIPPPWKWKIPSC